MELLSNSFLAIIRRPTSMPFYGKYNALFNIETLEMIESDLPPRDMKMVIEWAGQQQNELLLMWNNQEFHKLPPLK